MTRAREILGNLNRERGGESDRFLGLLSQGERLRLGLIALARLLRRMERETGQTQEEWASFRKDATRVLRAIGETLLTHQNFGAPEMRQELNDSIKKIRTQQLDRAENAFLNAVIRDAVHQMESVGGQIFWHALNWRR